LWRSAPEGCFKRNTWQFTTLFMNKVTDNALIAAGGSSNVGKFLKHDFEYLS